MIKGGGQEEEGGGRGGQKNISILFLSHPNVYGDDEKSTGSMCGPVMPMLLEVTWLRLG